ncbi:uncharacterized protein LOC122507629 [Leptopilina heterotoma]|uniref:uncharacterized protein LOC122507629 n=1 Tax=Leptopilina heterotoma TaxID=63436 RepID=UPI001CA88CC6|nr:uncharacterized protein LOC122507629 [Leptopilina heterotoma]
MSALEQKRGELQILEHCMNKVYAEIDTLEKEEAESHTISEDSPGPEEEKMADDEEISEHEEKTFELEEEILDHEAETVRFLGTDPAGLTNQELKLNEDIALRIKSWINKGLREKDEKKTVKKLYSRLTRFDLAA